ncbi:hypothetical protein [Halobacillus karajensis]|uniref:Lipoprotein n=1 Tax=Halobacillus karajensis TaxID=195088 RepID=A0A024PA44_9BACI|nr:hypothetical protein [Halobacillus karajensis]CDQ20065.1 hypothetical protein BN982_02378 [Halobacillus karajensis]CDQ25272.1 hypothetical protein BN983_03587 [Halobacillus karajensis]CDQ28367.1 hypothetical protein BN981_02665 [Halobacillus karajensis]
MNNIRNFFTCHVLFLLLILLLVGCTSSANDESDRETPESNDGLDSEEESVESEGSNKINDEGGQLESTTDLDESGDGDSKETSSGETTDEKSNHTGGSGEDDLLSNYSPEEIEYARVWLQLGEIKQVDELNVKHIPEGTPLHPDDHTSASYPEDVVQLAGSRLVAGSITYSSNGDGTINVYNVPVRWDGKYPAGERFYKDIIENTDLVQVDPGNDEDIIALINVLNIHE